jgi:hypothetical protein
LWLYSFGPVSEACRRASVDDIPDLLPDWNQVAHKVRDVIADVEVRTINGTAKDALDYADRGGKPLTVIAIGGDKLARGLTLEGLSTSYFLRASRMYDTLMQMGRWFGYRPGFLDLCRLYTTADLIEWFGHIADASEELREEFDLMAASGATPRQYGLKVQSHSVLMVTSQLKMRSARNLMLSFSGQLLETVAFHRAPDLLEKNLEAMHRLLAGLGTPEVNPIRARGDSRQQWAALLWERVVAADVCDFLLSYRTHPAAHKVNSILLAEFIQKMASDGELTEWTVALIGGGDGESHAIKDNYDVRMLKRVNIANQEDRYSIGRLLSPRDEAIDLDAEAWAAALMATRASWHADAAREEGGKEPDLPNGPAIRRIRGYGSGNVAGHPERGLLLLYLLDPRTEWTGLPDGSPPVAAFAVAFPGSDSGRKVEYKVNNVLWELEYGSAE